MTSAAPSGQKYRLDLQYIGTPFDGWQSQASGRAVQDVLEGALGTLLRHPVRLTGAARTDAGVHAKHQVATFTTPVPFDGQKWVKSLEALVPLEIGVIALAPCDPEFHPVRSARAKAYRYRLWCSQMRDPFLWPFCWPVRRPLLVDAMQEAAGHLVGSHDFTSFCSLHATARTRVRRVREIVHVTRGDAVDIWVVGDGFLKQMVRTLAGTLYEVGIGRLPPAAVAQILAKRDRQAAPATAPAAGLTLMKIFYADEPPAVATLVGEEGVETTSRSASEK